MSIYEAIGLSWVIFTSGIATVGILYLSFVGVKVMVRRHQVQENVPVEVKEMFKIAS
jgi:hypothetical protein